jgi:transposase-like protein
MCTWGWKSSRRLWVCNTPTAPGVAANLASLRLKLASVCQAHWVTPEQAEIARLRAENARLKMERDIAKKAAAYFAQDVLESTPGSVR